MSNGPSGIAERLWSSDIVRLYSSSSLIWKIGGIGALFGLFANYLITRKGSWSDQSSTSTWFLLFLLFIYTLLIFLISYLNSTGSNQSGTNNNNQDQYTSLEYFILPPKYPSRLQRVRSYLAFFPITHILQEYDNGNGNHQNHNNLDAGEGEARSGGGGCEGIDSLSSEVDREEHDDDQDNHGEEGITARIHSQLDMAIDAIVAEYVAPWYTKISDDGIFLEQCKSIIHSIFLHFAEKLKNVDRNELAKEAIQIIHIHWREYADALSKCWERNNGNGSGGDDLQGYFKFAHPFLNDNKEVSKCYQNLITKILEELEVPDLNSAVMCQFLAGILVKNFVLFYMEMICQPSWVNGTLMSLLSSGSVSVDITGSSSQNSSSPASPLPDPSPKQPHNPVTIFEDEVVNDCVSLCPSSCSPLLTGEDDEVSSPTKKSCCSSIKSVSESHDEHYMTGGSQQSQPTPNKKTEEQTEQYPHQHHHHQLQHQLEIDTSLSLEEGGNSELPTECSSNDSPGGSQSLDRSSSTSRGKEFDEGSKWSISTSSTSSIHPTSEEPIIPLTKRPNNLAPLKSPVASMRTVTTALGRVMKATAFPLLPSECYTVDHKSSSNVSVTRVDESDLLKTSSESKTPSLFEECRDSDSKEYEEEQDQEEESDGMIMMMTTQDSVFEPDVVEAMKDAIGANMDPIQAAKQEDEDIYSSSSPPTANTVTNNKGTSAHYYSFDEASKPKPANNVFFEASTLSLDGAIDGRKEDKSKNTLQLCSHEYKSESGSSGGGRMGGGAFGSNPENNKPHRSPVYEEPEDFAASIAKLRSLLEQKERKSSTPPMSAGMEEGGDVFESPTDSPAPNSAPPSAGEHSSGSAGSNFNISGTGIIPQISEPCASEETHTTPSSTSSMDISKGSSSRFSFNETMMIPSESDSTSILVDPIKNYNNDTISVNEEDGDPVPEIKCCFRNVSIPKVENPVDAGGQYIYYCIQYEGVYFDEYETHPPKLVYRTTTIKRKFKEFLTLQAHLEENPAYKPHLKGIKTPTRWLNASLTKSDVTVANQRRSNLEKYLQQLCYHPILGFCQEVLIFMAYGEDGFCSFEVGDPKDLLSHRLDKLAKKFTGVFNTLKDALPTFELDLSPAAPHTPKSEGVTPSDFKQGSSFPSFPFQEKFSNLTHHNSEESKETEDGLWNEKFHTNWTHDNRESASTEGRDKNHHPPLVLGNDGTDFNPSSSEGVGGGGGGAVGDVIEEGKIFSVYPLAAAVTHLLCDVLWLPQYRPHPTSVATFMSISGRSLENYAMETMDIFCSEEAILGYLEWLTVSIKTGQYETDSQKGDVSNQDLYSEQDLKNIVKRRIPAWVRWMWGRNRLDLTIDRITGLFQSPLVNHDLVLSLSELLFSKMVILDENIRIAE